MGSGRAYAVKCRSQRTAARNGAAQGAAQAAGGAAEGRNGGRSSQCLTSRPLTLCPAEVPSHGAHSRARGERRHPPPPNNNPFTPFTPHPGRRAARRSRGAARLEKHTWRQAGNFTVFDGCGRASLCNHERSEGYTGEAARQHAAWPTGDHSAAGCRGAGCAPDGPADKMTVFYSGARAQHTHTRRGVARARRALSARLPRLGWACGAEPLAGVAGGARAPGRMRAAR